MDSDLDSDSDAVDSTTSLLILVRKRNRTKEDGKQSEWRTSINLRYLKRSGKRCGGIH